MPELPDIELYLHALRARIQDQPLVRIRLASPFLLRSVEPPPDALTGLPVRQLRRLGKRIVIGFEGDLFAVVHLMIAGRLQWRKPDSPIPRRLGLAAFDFPGGALLLTEAGTRKRASLHLCRGEAAVAAHDPGGIDVLGAGVDAFRGALTARNHTVKRALTDPRILSGIGNAYSDEILHRARLSPFKQTAKLSDEDLVTLLQASRDVLDDWTMRLRDEVGDGWPSKVTAFKEGMAVHGRYREPCPDCGAPVQRIRYAANEANYCARCQTSGKVLADRGLSRLLKKDWPRTLEELEAKLGR